MSDQIFLTVYWSIDGQNTVQRDPVTTHIGDRLEPDLTKSEMQEIVMAARAKFAEIVRNRKRIPHDKGTNQE